MKITIPDSLAEKMALFPEADFRKLATEAIGHEMGRLIFRPFSRL